MDHQEVGWSGIHGIVVAQDRNKQQAFVNAAMNLRGFIKCGEFLYYLGIY
jgi:hypothetical protein